MMKKGKKGRSKPNSAKRQTRFRYHYMLRMPQTAYVTDREGGNWIPFHEFKGLTIHSILFVGGHQWDAVNGWRNTDHSSTSGRLLTCRKSELRAVPKGFAGIQDDAPYAAKDLTVYGAPRKDGA